MFLFVGTIALATLGQTASPPPRQTNQPSDSAPIQYCDSLIIDQTRSALSTLRTSRTLHCGDAPRNGITCRLEGTIAIEGHYMHPGMVRSLPIQLDYTIDAATGSVLYRETVGPPDRARTETTIVHLNRVATQSSRDQPFAESADDAARNTIADLTCWLPTSAVPAALNAAATCRLAPAITDNGQSRLPISFIDSAGRAVTLLLDDQHRVNRIERLAADARLGDLCNWTRFDDWQTHDAITTPQRISRFIVQSGVTLRFDLTMTHCKTIPLTDNTFALPDDRRSDIPTWCRPPSPTNGFEFVSIAPQVWSVEIAAANVRVLVIERDKDLVLLDAPEGDDICGNLVTALRDRFKNKPIGIVAFGHHHPSPSGGLRAIATTGARIVAPRAVESYLGDLLNRPTSLGAPAITAPVDVPLDLFDDQTTIDCGDASVRLIDIGEQSAHAFCYVVFYFPRSGVLFEDDLGYFALQGEPVAGPRLIGLVAALESHNIEPTRLIQQWPVRDVHREVPWETVKACVAKAARN